jgi:hypothetical protein
MNPAMNESAMRADRGGDDKGKAFFNGLSQDHLDVFICSHSSLTAANKTVQVTFLAPAVTFLAPLWLS